MKRQRISKAIAGLQTTFHHFAYGETVLFRGARYLGVRLAVLRIAKVKFSLLQRRKLILRQKQYSCFWIRKPSGAETLALRSGPVAACACPASFVGRHLHMRS